MDSNFMDSNVMAKIDGTNNAIKEMSNAINYQGEIVSNVRNALNRMQEGLGGQAGRNMNDKIQSMYQSSYNIASGLRETANIINSEKNNLQQNMK